jgi:hypothetical protein
MRADLAVSRKEASMNPVFQRVGDVGARDAISLEIPSRDAKAAVVFAGVPLILEQHHIERTARVYAGAAIGVTFQNGARNSGKLTVRRRSVAG